MSDPAHEQTDRMIEEIRRRVSREYLRAYEETSAKLEDYLSRFEAKDRIHAEAVRRGEETEEEYREWRRGQVLMGERWQEMVDTLAEDYRNADRIAASIINGYLPDAYALNHDYATFQVEQGSKVDTSYTLYDRATVERLIREQPDLLPEAKVDGKKDLAWNRRHIASAVTQGVLQGENMDKVAKRIRSVADMDFRASMRTARTAMTSAQNAGRTDAYRRAQGMGIRVRKQWLATLDRRTRHSHRRLDGEVVGLDERFSNGLEYPGDPSGAGSEVYNCRCTLVPDLPGVDASEGGRASKLGGMSYEQWRAEREVGARPSAVSEQRTYREAPGEDFVKSQGYSSWVGGLSDEERDAVEKYTSDKYALVNSYYRGTGDFAPDGKYGAALSDQAAVSYVRDNPLSRRDGESMPQYLRRKRGDEYAPVRAAVSAADSAKSIAGGLDSAIAGYTLPNDTVLFRRVKADALPDDLEGLIGSTYRDDGFISTSVFNSNNFVGGGEYLMHISVPSGTGRGMYVNDLSTSRDEYEFILARGSEFTITDVSAGGGVTHVFMEMIV